MTTKLPEKLELRASSGTRPTITYDSVAAVGGLVYFLCEKPLAGEIVRRYNAYGELKPLLLAESVAVKERTRITKENYPFLHRAIRGVYKHGYGMYQFREETFLSPCSVEELRAGEEFLVWLPGADYINFCMENNEHEHDEKIYADDPTYSGVIKIIQAALKVP